MPAPRRSLPSRRPGSVSAICLSGEASNAFSIVASRFTSSSRFASSSFGRVLGQPHRFRRFFSCSSWLSAVHSWLMQRATLSSMCFRGRWILPCVKVVVAAVHGFELAAYSMATLASLVGQSCGPGRTGAAAAHRHPTRRLTPAPSSPRGRSNDQIIQSICEGGEDCAIRPGEDRRLWRARLRQLGCSGRQGLALRVNSGLALKLLNPEIGKTVRD